MRRWLVLTLDVVLALGPSSAFGATAGAGTDDEVETSTVIDIGDDVIEGDLVRPEGAAPAPEPPQGEGVGAAELDLQWLQLGIAENFFNEGSIAAAMGVYEAAIAGDDPEVTVYATYKLGWCHYNLGDMPLAASAMLRVLELTSQDEGAAGDNGAVIRDAARKDLVLIAAVMPLAEGLPLVESLAPADSTLRVQLLVRYAQRLESIGKLRDAEQVRALLGG